jgi:hypothetical protein
MHPSRLCLLAVLLIAAHAAPASSRTWYILADGTGDAPTIQAGVDSAAAGDLVLVAAGTYSTMANVIIDGAPTAVCVSITKNIRLVSESGPETTTIGNTSADVAIYLEGVGSTAEVSGFRIRTVFEAFGCVDAANRTDPIELLIGIKCKNASPRIASNQITEHGIAIDLHSSPALIVDNVINLSLFGVICSSGSDASITDNVIHHCAELIRSVDSVPQIVGNEMYEGCNAVVCTGGSSVRIAENTIHNISPVAIECGGLSEATIENNHFYDNVQVIRLSSIAGNSVVRGNTFHDQVFEAIRLEDTHRAVSMTIENNTIDHTTLGSAIFCYARSSPMIRNNIIVRSVGGIDCLALSFPVIECNNIFDVPYPYPGECSNQTGINGNIAVDPQFCGVAGSHNYTLQGDSPCAPGNHPNGDDCGQIGAMGVACGTVPAKSVTWGQIKALYESKR